MSDHSGCSASGGKEGVRGGEEGGRRTAGENEPVWHVSLFLLISLLTLVVNNCMLLFQ